MKVAQKGAFKTWCDLGPRQHYRNSGLEGTMEPKCSLFCNKGGHKQNISGGITGRSMGYTHRITCYLSCAEDTWRD